MNKIPKLQIVKTLKVFALVFAVAIPVTQISGCMTVGKEFTTLRVEDIKIGQTTQQEILEMFGPPWRMGLEDGRKTWTYGEYKYSLIGPADTQDLVIRFDNQGVVRSYTFNTSKK